MRVYLVWTSKWSHSFRDEIAMKSLLLVRKNDRHFNEEEICVLVACNGIGNVHCIEWMWTNNLIKITHELLKIVLFCRRRRRCHDHHLFHELIFIANASVSLLDVCPDYKYFFHFASSISLAMVAFASTDGFCCYSLLTSNFFSSFYSMTWWYRKQKSRFFFLFEFS